jgi:hypothetical protein
MMWCRKPFSNAAALKGRKPQEISYLDLWIAAATSIDMGAIDRSAIAEYFEGCL